MRLVLTHTHLSLTHYIAQPQSCGAFDVAHAIYIAAITVPASDIRSVQLCYFAKTAEEENDKTGKDSSQRMEVWIHDVCRGYGEAQLTDWAAPILSSSSPASAASGVLVASETAM